MNNLNINKLFFASLLIPCMIFSSCKKEVQEQSMLKAQTVFGEVTLESDGKVITPVPGTEIKENSIIKTGKLSIIDLVYKDSGLIRINENTVLDVARLFTSDQGDETSLKVDKGKVFVTVSKLLKKSSFQVQTGTIVAAVRGTTFRVSADEESSRIDVLSGRIRVNPVKDNRVIETVEQIVETNNTVEIEAKAVDEIIEDKKEIEVVKLEQEQIDSIKEEVKLIKMDETMAQETKNEIKEIGIEVKPAEEIKDENEYKEELTVQLQKVNNENELNAEREAEEKAKALEAEEKEKERQSRIEAQEAKKKQDKMRKEQLKLERLQKEAEKEKQIMDQQRKEEQAKQEQLKVEKKKEEERVKNIPNF